MSVTESVFSKRRLWRERVPGRDSRKEETVGAGEEGETTPLTKRNLLLDDMFFWGKEKAGSPKREKTSFYRAQSHPSKSFKSVLDDPDFKRTFLPGKGFFF